MIPLDKLKSIKHLCTHASCPDGIASALIIKDALPDVKVSFMLYGTQEHRELEPSPGTLFCDFTPYIAKNEQDLELGSDYLENWVKSGAIVLDHHPTAKDIVEAFGENGVFGENDKNECGAWLAFFEVWRRIRNAGQSIGAPMGGDEPENQVFRFAQLAAIRDTWKKDDPRWQAACEQAAALVFFPFEEIPSLQHAVADASEIGRLLLKKQLAAAQRSLDEALLLFTDKGTEVWMFQGVSTTSDAAELAEKLFEKTLHQPVGPSQPNLIVGFHYRFDAGKLQLQFSMRSHTGYDVSAFAKAHGGGGHKAAAGFTVEVSPELSANPYQTFRLLLDQWEGGRIS